MKNSHGAYPNQGSAPVAPERVRATPDEIAALKAMGFKLSRKEKRAERAQQRKRKAGRSAGD